MIVVRVMTIKDYDDVYELWMHTKGMGMRNLDDSRSGIARAGECTDNKLIA